MTATAVPARTAPADLRTAQRWLAALVLPIGPAAIALLRYVLPYDTVDDPVTVAQRVAADPGAQSLVLWLGFVGALTLVPGVLAVARLTRRAAPRTTAAALLLIVPAYLLLAWLTAGDVLLLAGVDAGLDPAVVATVWSAMHPTAGLSTVVFVVGHVLGTVVLGVALWRADVVPRWAAVATAISQPLHFVAAVVVVSHPLDLAAWGLNAVAFAVVAFAVVRCPDDEWDLPPQRRA